VKMKVRHLTCCGALQKINNLLFVKTKNPRKNIIYFPGDVQNLESEMKNGYYSSYAEDYSLEKTALLLATRCTDSNIFIVRPARFGPDHESHFDHLLRPGVGLLHLKSLLQDALKQTKQDSKTGVLPIFLLAFSKGCLVLNNFLSEISTLESLSTSSPPQYIVDWEDESMSNKLPSYEPSQLISRTKTTTDFIKKNEKEIFEFVKQIHGMHYLDGHRFPTNVLVIENFVKAIAKIKNYKEKETLKIELSGTPRQIRDTKREFIRFEFETYIKWLRYYNEKEKNVLEIVDKLYFEDQKASFRLHFDVLKTAI